jgi:hypothetical protein
LKGTGWYVTDYANRPGNTDTVSENKAEGANADKSEKTASLDKKISTAPEKKSSKTKEPTAPKNLKNSSLQT